MTLMDIVNAKQTDDGIVIDAGQRHARTLAPPGAPTRALIAQHGHRRHGRLREEAADPGRRLSRRHAGQGSQAVARLQPRSDLSDARRASRIATPTQTEVVDHRHRQAAGRPGRGRTSAPIASRSPTRARACAMWANTSPAKKARRSKERRKMAISLKGIGPPQGPRPQGAQGARLSVARV